MRALVGSLVCVAALTNCGNATEAPYAAGASGGVPSGGADVGGNGPVLISGNAGSGVAGVSTSVGGAGSDTARAGAPSGGIASGGTTSAVSGASGSAEGESAGAAGAESEPSDACLDLRHPLQLDYFLHVPIDKHLPRSQRSLAAEWYEELGNVQKFKLAAGELNQVDGKATGRVEAFGASWRSQGEWHEFAASYRLIQAGGAAIFQLKAASPIDWEVQITHALDGSITYQPRRNPSMVLDRDMVGKDFHLRVRSNGRQFEVYYNCELVERREHPMDPSGASSYAFRWGLYPGMIATHDMALEVRGASWN